MTQTNATQIFDDKRYLEPSWFTQHVMNRGIRRLARLGSGPTLRRPQPGAGTLPLR